MTPTSDERREVAERMRVYSHDFDFGGSDPFWYVSKAAFGDVDVRTYHSVFARLADLIDPTCEVVGDNTYTSDYDFRCKTCGEHFSAASTPRYCPGCGRRIDYGDR